MLETLDQASEIARRYGVPTEDVILIAFNCLGADSDSPDHRVRFFMKLHTFPDEFYFGLPIKQLETPFYLDTKLSQVLFKGEPVGAVREIENDNCASSYWRRNETALTMNTNARTLCKGCAFCGTYGLDADDHDLLNTKGKLQRDVKLIMDEKGMKDLSGLYEVAVVTGCFNREDKALEHLLMLRDALGELGFTGELKYLGSEITSDKALDTLAERVAPFSLYFTVDCFTRRDQMLRPNKARMTLDQTRDVMRRAKERGLETSMTYILGLDPIDAVLKEFPGYVPVLTRFPAINLLQPYEKAKNSIRTPEGGRLDYYLSARRGLEDMFGSTHLRPVPWENYRSPWYLRFGAEPLDGIRI